MPTEMHDTSGSLFFDSYIVLGFLILLNMLLAIILEAYAAVKQASIAKQTLSDDMKFLFDTSGRVLQRSEKVLSAEKLFTIVDQWMDSTEEVRGSWAAARLHFAVSLF